MPRVARVAPGGVVYHVFNRGNGRQELFLKDSDYAGFLKLLAEVKEVIPVKVLAYCLMPTHWHLVLLPKKDGDLSKFMLRVTTSHVRRHYSSQPELGGGHLYQGRFKNFPIEQSSPFLTVCRFVESNALRSKLVRKAEKWKWSSLYARENDEGGDLLDAWPVSRPKNWAPIVNGKWEPEELETLETCVTRGRPFGTPTWVNRAVDRMGLQYTVRPRGRPRKTPAGKK